MSFLKKIFRNVFRDAVPSHAPSSFDRLSDEELEAHLGVERYGEFRLTGAVRPSYDLQVIPAQGFRHDIYRDEDSKSNVPVLMGACSEEQLFEVFMDILDPLGSEVDVVLETSHNRNNQGHVDLYREHIDMPVLKSILYDFEDLLINDGCTGIAVLNPSIPQEVQFDEHKLLIIYGQELGEYEQIFKGRRVGCNDQMKFITEAEHVHSSTEAYAARFEELKMRLSIDSGY